MNCTDATEQMKLLAVGGLTADEQAAVEFHAAGCSGCAAVLEEYRLLASDIRAARPTENLVPLASLIRNAVHDEVVAARRRSRFRRVLMAGGAIAATLMAAISIWQAVVSFRSPSLPIAATPPISAAQPVVHVSLKQVWQHTGARATPVSDATAAVVRGQSIYLLLTEGEQVRVSALDAKTGNVKWQAPAVLESIGYLAADDERVYCLAAVERGMTELVALDAASGAIRWRFTQEDRTRPVSPSRPVVMPDGRVCWTTNAAVHMLKPTSGEIAWSRPIPQEGLLSAALAAADGIYVVSNSGLYCLSPKYGDIVWRQGLGGEFSRLGRPTIQAAAGRVFAAMRKRDGRGQVICLDTAAHNLAWSKSIPQVFQLQAADGRLYVRGQGVQALDLESGEQLWSCKASGCGPVSVLDGVVYFVDTTGPGRLVAVNSRNGQAVWDMAGIQSCEAFLPENGVGYFKTSDGILRAMVLASR